MSILEPQIARLIWLSHSSDLSPRRVDKAAELAAWELFHLMEAFEKEADTDDYRKIWIPVDRGAIEDWMSYEDYVEYYFEPTEDFSEPSREAWRAEWEWEFPEQTYWHLLSVNRYEEHLSLALDGRAFMGTDANGPNAWEYPDDEVDIHALIKSVERVVELAREGEYVPMLERELPAYKRRGIIKRSDLWQLYPGSYDIAPGLSPDERKARANKLLSQGDEGHVAPMRKLTTGMYFSTLKEAYIRTGRNLSRADTWHGFDVDDGRAWYCRYGDARDESILELDMDSAQALLDWETDKTQFRNHTFEIFAGHGFSRCHLSPSLAEDGWRLSLWGSIPFHGDDLFVVWETFNEAGLTTYLYDAPSLADAYLGDDYLLVVPEYEWPIYQDGNYSGHKVVEAIHLPEEHREAVASMIEWFPIDVSVLRV